MTKVGIKTASSVPPSDDSNEQRYREDIQSWFRGEYGIDPANDLELTRWAEKAIEQTDETLKKLFFKYSIFPGHVLQLLAEYKLSQWRQCTTAKIRSRKKREKDAALLERAARLLYDWGPVITWDVKAPFNKFVYSQSVADDVKEIANVIRELGGPSKSYRPREDELRKCGLSLCKFFQSRTGFQLYSDVGELLKGAFFKEWGAGGDLKDAAKKLLKERRQKDKNR
jgi:hypothetical protein